MDGGHRLRWVEHALDEGLLAPGAVRELLGPSAEDTLMYRPDAALSLEQRAQPAPGR